MLNLPAVLVLNRHWQAIHVKTPAEAVCMIATGAATALDVQADDHVVPASALIRNHHRVRDWEHFLS